MRLGIESERPPPCGTLTQNALSSQEWQVATYVLEQGRYPVQLEHMLFPHVALQLLNALMRL